MRRTAAVAVAGWLAVLGAAVVITRGAVALPEHCGTAAEPALDAAIDGAVGWFDINQRPDGTWLYRYDADTDTDLGGYSWVRHAGVLLSLYQAAAAGEPVAREVADRGRAAIDADATVDGTDWAAVEDGGWLTTGGTALLVAALGERRDVTGLPVDDDLLRRLGRFIARQVDTDGAVWELAYPDGNGVADSVSPFTTGEAFFALARLHRQFPTEGWDAPALRIARYVTTERADREGFVPDMSDHWSAYAFAEVARWPERAATGLDAVELGFARRQMGLMSIQTRYETQRTNAGLSRLVRGRTALGAATGTIGEAMAAWWDVGARAPALDGRRGALRDRLDCMAGAIVARQTTRAEVSPPTAPAQAAGAWFQFGITQMDDQQHSLSALVAARRVLSDPTPVPRRSPIPTNLLLLALATVAALNPLRLASGASGPRRRRIRDTAIAGGITLGVAAALAALGGPLLRGLDVSAGNGLIAAGVVLVAGGLYALATPNEAAPAGLLVPLVIPLGLRPDLLLLAVAAGAGGRGWAFTAALAVAVLISAAVASAPAPPPIVHRWLMRVIATLATLTALALLIDGVYAI